MGNLWLIGMMGSGKTSTGLEIAHRTGARFLDTDSEIAARLGCSIGELWGTKGEEAFRDMEAAQVLALTERDRVVIATGGGVVLRPENVAAMRRSGLVVWLAASPDALERRLGAGEERPLLSGEDVGATVRRLSVERAPLYAAAAHGHVETDDRSTSEIAEEVASLWMSS